MKNLITKTTLGLILSLATISTAYADDTVTTTNDQVVHLSTASTDETVSNRRPAFDGQRFGEGGRGRGPSPAERQAFEQCMAAQGIQPPARPQLTDEQKAAFENCRSQSSGRDAMEQCLSNAGIQKPERPQMSQSVLGAIQACREKSISASVQ